MARGSKKKYTSKQKRKAHKIEKGYKKRGVGSKEAERCAWATVNKSDRGGRKKGRDVAAKSEANQVPAKVGEKVAESRAAQKVALAAAKLPLVSSYNFEQLQRSAEQQVERIEAERISATRQAFPGAIRSK